MLGRGCRVRARSLADAASVRGWRVGCSSPLGLSKRGDPRRGVARRTDLLLSSGAGLVLQHAGRWDGAAGEGCLRTHAALVLVGCGGAGLLGAGDSGPSHAWIQTSVPEITVLQGQAAPPVASPGAAPGFQVFGASSAERGPGEPCRAPPWSRLCLAVGQKQKMAPKGTWKLLSRDGDPPGLALGERGAVWLPYGLG